MHFKRQSVSLFNYMRSWMILCEIQSLKRANFFKLRANHLTSNAFNALNAHRRQKTHFRSRLHRFLRIRASSLLKKAFSGIHKYSRDRSLDFKLLKVAYFVHLRKILMGTFSTLKTKWLKAKAFKHVHSR